MCVFKKLLGLEYDQGPLAFIKELLLRNVFKALCLRTLELRTIYRGFTRKRKRKRSQWGSISRKASQKWIKIAIWQMEFVAEPT
jgi:hypothetical protein